jgi:hypothetical protein
MLTKNQLNVMRCRAAAAGDYVLLRLLDEHAVLARVAKAAVKRDALPNHNGPDCYCSACEGFDESVTAWKGL